MSVVSEGEGSQLRMSFVAKVASRPNYNIETVYFNKTGKTIVVSYHFYMHFLISILSSYAVRYHYNYK